MSVIFRVAEVLRTRLKKLEGNMCALEREIKTAVSGDKDKRAPDRRALQKIIGEQREEGKEDEEDFFLNLRHLRALDKYLTQFGEGLSEKPIFQQVGILESLAERRKVSFLLGSRPDLDHRRQFLSRWDSRAMASLLHEMCQIFCPTGALANAV